MRRGSGGRAPRDAEAPGARALRKKRGRWKSFWPPAECTRGTRSRAPPARQLHNAAIQELRVRPQGPARAIRRRNAPETWSSQAEMGADPRGASATVTMRKPNQRNQGSRASPFIPAGPQGRNIQCERAAEAHLQIGARSYQAQKPPRALHCRSRLTRGVQPTLVFSARQRHESRPNSQRRVAANSA